MPRSGHLDLFRPARHSICILYYFPYIHLTVAIDNAITSQVITGVCLYRKLDSAIVMMKSAEDRHSCDAAYVLDGAMDRSVFAKRPMSPQLVIISGILRQDPA